MKLQKLTVAIILSGISFCIPFNTYAVTTGGKPVDPILTGGKPVDPSIQTGGKPVDPYFKNQ